QWGTGPGPANAPLKHRTPSRPGGTSCRAIPHPASGALQDELIRRFGPMSGPVPPLNGDEIHSQQAVKRLVLDALGGTEEPRRGPLLNGDETHARQAAKRRGLDAWGATEEPRLGVEKRCGAQPADPARQAAGFGCGLK